MSAKAKACNTCIAPQVAYRNCRGAGHDTERAGVGPTGRRLSRLMVATPVIHLITWTTTHLPTPKGWKAELAWLVDP